MKRSEKNRRTFFGRVMVLLLSVLAVLGLVATALSVINAYINPQDYIWTTVFGLAFWEILFFDLAVFLLLLVFWSNKIWIVVAALVIAIPGIAKSFSFGTTAKADDSIRIMSYNVHLFRHIDGETDNEQCAFQIMEKIREKSPDILCCQEFFSFKKGVSRPKCIEAFAEAAGFQYIYYNQKNDSYGGNVIFSKYPMTKVAEDSGIGKGKSYGIMVEVDAGDKGKFHLANIHLLSYKITDDEIDILTHTSDLQNNLDTVGKTVLHKLSFGFQSRSGELQRVFQGMPSVEGPVIVCGDFNETPMSYNYRQMRKAGYVDTFIKAGFGIKPTYAGKLPLLRIDYIWAKDGVRPLAFERYDYKASDHYPIILDFSINK